VLFAVTLASVVLALVGLSLAGLSGPVATAGAQTSVSPPTVPATDRVATTVAVPVGVATPNIIPAPNSGHTPRDAGERGGWMQELLFFAICGAIAVIGGLVWRESRQKRRAQGRLTSTRTP